MLKMFVFFLFINVYYVVNYESYGFVFIINNLYLNISSFVYVRVNFGILLLFIVIVRICIKV